MRSWPVCTVYRQSGKVKCVDKELGVRLRSMGCNFSNRLVCVFLSRWLGVFVFKTVYICICLCVCLGWGERGESEGVCRWRISVPLQSSGRNEMGHWLHDGPPPTGGAPLPLFSLSCVFAYWFGDSGCMLGLKTMNSVHVRVHRNSSLQLDSALGPDAIFYFDFSTIRYSSKLALTFSSG